MILCAWCEAKGQPGGAARDPASAEWRAVSHEYAREAKRNGLASHGICSACLPLVLTEWGLKGR